MLSTHEKEGARKRQSDNDELLALLDVPRCPQVTGDCIPDSKTIQEEGMRRYSVSSGAEADDSYHALDKSGAI